MSNPSTRAFSLPAFRLILRRGEIAYAHFRACRARASCAWWFSPRPCERRANPGNVDAGIPSPRVLLINSVRTQTISIGANRVSPAIFSCARRHRRRIQFSRQLPQNFREDFFHLSLHWTSRFRPLQGWFTPLRRLAILLKGRSPFSCDCTLSA